MMGKTHLIAGLAAGVASIVVNDMPYPAIVLAGVAVGSLAPDIDHPKSIISRKLRPVRWLASLFKHRGFFHSFIGWFAVVLAMTVLVSPVTSINSDISVMVGIFIGAFAYGYILHIAMDAMTTQGVKLFYPHQGYIGLGVVKTAGLSETVFTVLWVVFMGLGAYGNFI